MVESWQRRGLLAQVLRPLSWVFGALIRCRSWLYGWGWRRIGRLRVPVIVVGNLIAGGAGKTPTVLALVSLLQSSGWRVGIISRGHGGQAKGILEVLPESDASEVGDEPLVLRRRAQVPVVVGRRRVLAGRHLLDRHPDINLIISDDGLQHTELHRDVQIVVFDERGCGNGWLLPAGPLREPLRSRCPPSTLVVYNAPQPTTPWPGHLGSRHLAGAVPWAEWKSGAPSCVQALEALAQRSRHETIWAAAGIAQPSRFFKLLEASGLRISELPLPDHHNFADSPPWPRHSVVVVTEKDAVKLNNELILDCEVWVIPLDFQLDTAFATELRSLLAQPAPDSP